MTTPLKTPAQVLTVVLAGICGLLLLVLAGQRLFGGGAEDEVALVAPSEGPRAAALQAGDFELPPLAQYQAIVQRPLFNETRRPVAQTDAAGQAEQLAQAQPEQLPQVTLTGVIITPEARFAMIRNNRNNEFYALQEGAPLEGWTLKSIAPRRVVFTSESGRQVVELEVYTAGGGAGPAQARTAQQPPSAAELIRQRIQQERERRRALIEAARKQQKNDG